MLDKSPTAYATLSLAELRQLALGSEGPRPDARARFCLA